MSRIPVAGPWITQREVDAVAHAAATAWYEHANDELAAFEAEFAAATSRRHAIAVPSCTAALHLSLLALGVGPGDEVIVPEATWIATAAPIKYLGATPVFVDVDPCTWCIGVDQVRDALTSRTKVIIPVDLYGGFPDWLALEGLAREHGCALVEDAAEAVGGIHGGRPAGSFGEASAFSFHGSKTLTTGEGGMVVCDDDVLHERMLFLRDHGRHPGDVSFRSVEIGHKYRMSSLQAALGRVQLERLAELIERKRTIFGWYREGLSDVPIVLNFERHDEMATYWMVTANFEQLSGLDVATVADAMNDADIATRPFFPPLSSLPAFDGEPGSMKAATANTVSYALSRTCINLPSALTLTQGDVERVCTVLRRLVRSHGHTDSRRRAARAGR